MVVAFVAAYLAVSYFEKADPEAPRPQAHALLPAPGEEEGRLIRFTPQAAEDAATPAGELLRWSLL